MQLAAYLLQHVLSLSTLRSRHARHWSTWLCYPTNLILEYSSFEKLSEYSVRRHQLSTEFRNVLIY